jgi:hypothetical protein
MLKTTSKARKQNLGLTVPVATRQARKVVDAAMPGVNATVESKFGYDMNADMQVVVTTITFPEYSRGADSLALAISDRFEPHGLIIDSARIVITRKR